jgi:hypothetical protein
MDREQEEAVQRITARYVAELRAGHHPRLSDYLARYPQFAGAITDFVTYYHAIEANIPEEKGVISPLSQATRAALDEAWKRVLRPESVANNVITSLQKAVEMYLGLAEPEQLARGVAEAPALYRVGEQSITTIQTQSFQQAIEQSTQLSNEQKGAWLSILEKEGLV